jgi:AbrB family looped-hinge helix DNA binding protein
MAAQTRLSAKGQVVIPKDVRDRLGLIEGTVFDVVETGDGLLLRKPHQRKKLSVDEALEQIRRTVHYKGPPLTIEQLSWSAEADRAYRRTRS